MRIFRQGLLVLTGGLLTISPVAAQAQSHGLTPFEAPRESRAMVAFVVPFGQVQRSEQQKSRLELQMVQLERNASDFNIVQSRNIVRKRTVGFTLDQQPQLAINGKIMGPVDDEKNLSPGAGIAIVGTLVAVGVLLAVVLDAKDAIEDLTDPD